MNETQNTIFYIVAFFILVVFVFLIFYNSETKRNTMTELSKREFF